MVNNIIFGNDDVKDYLWIYTANGLGIAGRDNGHTILLFSLFSGKDCFQ